MNRTKVQEDTNIDVQQITVNRILLIDSAWLFMKNVITSLFIYVYLCNFVQACLYKYKLFLCGLNE